MHEPGRVLAVCRSTSKGTPKERIARGWLRCGHGLDGDAHAGPGHRQISLLAAEDIRTMEAHGLTLAPGAFGENLIVEGIALAAIEVGARVRVGGAVLRVTQLGKACHTRCAIYETAGDCIMPRRGVFAEVVEPGAVVRGSVVERLDEAAPHEATEAAG